MDSSDCPRVCSFHNKRNYENLSTLRFFRSFIQFVTIVFPSMTPSMFYSIYKPCCSLQTTPFPFSYRQKPPILISNHSHIQSPITSLFILHVHNSIPINSTKKHNYSHRNSATANHHPNSKGTNAHHHRNTFQFHKQ